MALAKVLDRGQITLPRNIRRLARIKSGDVASIKVIGPGQLSLTILPRLSPRELRGRFPIKGPIDEPADREAWQATAADETIGKGKEPDAGRAD